VSLEEDAHSGGRCTRYNLKIQDLVLILKGLV
jgi:hypothetical protein